MKDYFERIDEAEADGTITSEQAEVLRKLDQSEATRIGQEYAIHKEYERIEDEDKLAKCSEESKQRIAEIFEKEHGLSPDLATRAAGILLTRGPDALGEFLRGLRPS